MENESEEWRNKKIPCCLYGEVSEGSECEWTGVVICLLNRLIR